MGIQQIQHKQMKKNTRRQNLYIIKNEQHRNAIITKLVQKGNLKKRKNEGEN